MPPNSNEPSGDKYPQDDPLLELYLKATEPPPMPAYLAAPGGYARPGGRVDPAPSARGRYTRYAMAAALLVAAGGAVWYWVGARADPPSRESVRPSQELPPAPAVRPVITCLFELRRPGPGGPVREGLVGLTPVVAKPGDTLVVSASAASPVRWVVVARAPDGTVVRLLPARGGKPDEPTSEVEVSLPIDRGGEWLAAAVATTDERGCRTLLATLKTDSELRIPLGIDDTLAYADGAVTASAVRGAPTSTPAARARFEQFCRRLADRANGETRAVAVPVAANP